MTASQYHHVVEAWSPGSFPSDENVDEDVDAQVFVPRESSRCNSFRPEDLISCDENTGALAPPVARLAGGMDFLTEEYPDDVSSLLVVGRER